MATWLQLASAFSSVIVEATKNLPVAVRTVIGWPNPRQIEIDMRKSEEDRAIISIYGLETVNNFRYMNPRECIERIDATEVIEVGDTWAKMSGVVTPGDNIFFFVNRIYDFAVQAVVGSTHTSIWDAIAEQINDADIGVLASVDVDTIHVTPDPTEIGHIYSHAYGHGFAKTEIARPQRRNQITIWAPTPIIRDMVSEVVMAALCRNNHYTLADNSIAYVRFAGSIINDFHQSAGIFLESLFYLGEYPVYLIDRVAIVGAVKGKLTTRAFDGSDVLILNFLQSEKEGLAAKGGVV